MTGAPLTIWQRLPAGWSDHLTASIARTDSLVTSATQIFFRADDIAVPGRQLQTLLNLFAHHECPLALAVVPAWLTAPRWKVLRRMGAAGSHLWCWHQHGWRHWNHESQGKKQEFGPSRTRATIFRDLDRGRQRLAAIMGPDFTPIFTPPWNRCSQITLALLEEMGYKAVSRSQGSQPCTPTGLPDHAVHIDLHTDRASNATDGWQRLMDQLTEGLLFPACGIMIHHQRMNMQAFHFLDTLLDTLGRQNRLKIADIRDL